MHTDRPELTLVWGVSNRGQLWCLELQNMLATCVSNLTFKQASYCKNLSAVLLKKSEVRRPWLHVPKSDL